MRKIIFSQLIILFVITANSQTPVIISQPSSKTQCVGKNGIGRPTIKIITTTTLGTTYEWQISEIENDDYRTINHNNFILDFCSGYNTNKISFSPIMYEQNENYEFIPKIPTIKRKDDSYTYINPKVRLKICNNSDCIFSGSYSIYEHQYIDTYKYDPRVFSTITNDTFYIANLNTYNYENEDPINRDKYFFKWLMLDNETYEFYKLHFYESLKWQIKTPNNSAWQDINDEFQSGNISVYNFFNPYFDLSFNPYKFYFDEINETVLTSKYRMIISDNICGVDTSNTYNLKNIPPINIENGQSLNYTLGDTIVIDFKLYGDTNRIKNAHVLLQSNLHNDFKNWYDITGYGSYYNGYYLSNITRSYGQINNGIFSITINGIRKDNPNSLFISVHDSYGIKSVSKDVQINLVPNRVSLPTVIGAYEGENSIITPRYSVSYSNRFQYQWQNKSITGEWLDIQNSTTIMGVSTHTLSLTSLNLSTNNSYWRLKYTDTKNNKTYFTEPTKLVVYRTQFTEELKFVVKSFSIDKSDTTYNNNQIETININKQICQGNPLNIDVNTITGDEIQINWLVETNNNPKGLLFSSSNQQNVFDVFYRESRYNYSNFRLIGSWGKLQLLGLNENSFKSKLENYLADAEYFDYQIPTSNSDGFKLIAVWRSGGREVGRYSMNFTVVSAPYSNKIDIINLHRNYTQIFQINFPPILTTNYSFPKCSNDLGLLSLDKNIKTFNGYNLRWQILNESNQWENITENELFRGDNSYNLTVSSSSYHLNNKRLRAFFKNDTNRCEVYSNDMPILLRPIPTITGLATDCSPLLGEQTITLSGQYLNETSQLSFFDINASTTTNQSQFLKSNTLLVSTIPSNVFANNIVVTSNQCGATSITGTFKTKPLISSIAPQKIYVGAVCSVFGQNLSSVNKLTIGGAASQRIDVGYIQRINSDLFVFTVPSGGVNSQMIARNECGGNSEPFTYQFATPTLTGISNTSACYGDVISVNGIGLFNSVLKIDNTTIASFADNPYLVLFTVPSNLNSGSLSLQNSYGNGVWNTPIFIKPTITSIVNPNTSVEQEITVLGINFRSTDQIMFTNSVGGNQNLGSITYFINPKTLVAIVPSGVKSGPILVKNNGCYGNSITTTGVNIQKPLITTLLGTFCNNSIVTVVGNYLTSLDKIKIGDLALTNVQKLDFTMSVVTVTGVFKQGNIYLENSYGKSNNVYVNIMPTITGISSTDIGPDEELTIFGNNLNKISYVNIKNNYNSWNYGSGNIYDLATATGEVLNFDKYVITIPNYNYPHSYTNYVYGNNLISTINQCNISSDENIPIGIWGAVIDGFSPNPAKEGDLVYFYGRYLNSAKYSGELVLGDRVHTFSTWEEGTYTIFGNNLGAFIMPKSNNILQYDVYFNTNFYSAVGYSPILYVDEFVVWQKHRNDGFKNTKINFQGMNFHLISVVGFLNINGDMFYAYPENIAFDDGYHGTYYETFDVTIPNEDNLTGDVILFATNGVKKNDTFLFRGELTMPEFHYILDYESYTLVNNSVSVGQKLLLKGANFPWAETEVFVDGYGYVGVRAFSNYDLDYFWVPCGTKITHIKTPFGISSPCRDCPNGYIEILDPMHQCPTVRKELEATVDNSITIVSNPSHDGIIKFISEIGMGNVEVYNSLGKLLTKQKFELGHNELSGLESGVYMLVFSNGKTIIQKKVIVI